MTGHKEEIAKRLETSDSNSISSILKASRKLSCLHGMQGVSGSNPLGSILENTVLDKGYGGCKTAFLVPFCSRCPT